MLYNLGFVTALIGFISIMNLIFLPLALLSEGEESALVLCILVLVVFLFCGATVYIRKTVMKRHRKPLLECDILLIIDLEEQVLLGKDEKHLADLSQVQFRREFQLTSSLPAYTFVWPEGKMVIVRGNIFAGGSDAIIQALKRHGIRPQ